MAYNAELILIVDESGSMLPMKRATIDSINELVQEQKRLPGDLAITMVAFSATTRPVRTRSPASSFNNLDDSDYRPIGMTALFDAICETLDVAEQWTVPAGTDRIVVIVTDGQSNTGSRTKEDAKSRIDRLAGLGWKFHFIGSGVDAMTDGAALGVPMAAVDLTTQVGTMSAYRGISATVSSLRAQP